ncbi:MAG: tellurite resistance TerB family protein, partial [Desulfovibrionaceae bacterium]|nr:tellurite resistance TerB family protein [Desulfovibrionaceae bacterium]
MALLDNLQSLLGGGQSHGQSGSNPLGSLLAPAALGGLMGALMGNKKTRGVTGNVLLLGGGAALAATLWNKYKNRPAEQPSAAPAGAYGRQPAAPQPFPIGAPQPAPAFGLPSSPDTRATRLIRAMIFAAKSDGIIDEEEQQAIQQTISQLNLGQDAEQIISQAINEPLDPRAIAQGVSSQEEALELYLVSSSVIEVDHFMESSYLDALARELSIPPELTQDIAQEIERSRQA